MILHLDMNAFFASVEQAANPALRDKPIVVGGGIQKSSVVAAASYEARAYGVKTGMSTWDARKLCPQLVVVVGDMAKYVYTSREIMQLLIEYTNLVEPFSIDEAFLDIGNLLPWEQAISIAKDIKQRIKKRFNLTCTIGIGPNKLLAKLAGELQKPDGLVVIRPEDFPHKVNDVAVSEFCGVGRKLTQYLSEMGIKTIGELNLCPRVKLVKRFGVAYGEHLWQMGQGSGSIEVRPYNHEEAAKSVGHSYTLPKSTSNLEEVKSYLLRLAEQVGRRLRQGNLRGNVVHVALGFDSSADTLHLHRGYDFWSQQKKVSDYLDDGYEVFLTAEKMIDKSLGEKAVRFVSISVTNLTHHLDQISIFESDEKKKKVLRAVDEINDHFGEFTIHRLRQAGIEPTTPCFGGKYSIR